MGTKVRTHAARSIARKLPRPRTGRLHATGSTSGLRLRFETLRAHHFVEKRRVRGITRGYLIFQYGFREYVELMLRQNKGAQLNADETRFFCAFAAVIGNGEVPEGEKAFIRDHILGLYGRLIGDLTPISANDQDHLLRQVEAA